jgi:hypothetical protein
MIRRNELKRFLRKIRSSVSFCVHVVLTVAMMRLNTCDLEQCEVCKIRVHELRFALNGKRKTVCGRYVA